MMEITNEEFKSCLNLTNCHKYTNDKDYQKDKDLRNYTSEYRGAAHSMCDLKYSILKEIPVDYHSTAIITLS